VRLVADDKAIAGKGRGGHAHATGVVDADQPVLFTGLENVRVTGFAQRKDMAAVCPGRCSEAGRLVRVNPFLVEM
ncbi:uncharacterized protein METZ01_LOCUS289634, partial [marine metagenome]